MYMYLISTGDMTLCSYQSHSRKPKCLMKFTIMNSCIDACMGRACAIIDEYIGHRRIFLQHVIMMRHQTVTSLLAIQQ